MKLFQVIREGSLWGVYAVNAQDQTGKLLVSNSLTADEQFAIEVASQLNRIAKTHNCDPVETAGVDLNVELGTRPTRAIRLDD